MSYLKHGAYCLTVLSFLVGLAGCKHTNTMGSAVQSTDQATVDGRQFVKMTESELAALAQDHYVTLATFDAPANTARLLLIRDEARRPDSKLVEITRSARQDSELQLVDGQDGKSADAAPAAKFLAPDQPEPADKQVRPAYVRPRAYAEQISAPHAMADQYMALIMMAYPNRELQATALAAATALIAKFSALQERAISNMTVAMPPNESYCGVGRSGPASKAEVIAALREAVAMLPTTNSPLARGRYMGLITNALSAYGDYMALRGDERAMKLAHKFWNFKTGPLAEVNRRERDPTLGEKDVQIAFLVQMHRSQVDAKSLAMLEGEMAEIIALIKHFMPTGLRISGFKPIGSAQRALKATIADWALAGDSGTMGSIAIGAGLLDLNAEHSALLGAGYLSGAPYHSLGEVAMPYLAIRYAMDIATIHEPVSSTLTNFIRMRMADHSTAEGQALMKAGYALADKIAAGVP